MKALQTLRMQQPMCAGGDVTQTDGEVVECLTRFKTVFPLTSGQMFDNVKARSRRLFPCRSISLMGTLLGFCCRVFFSLYITQCCFFMLRLWLGEVSCALDHLRLFKRNNTKLWARFF